MMMKKLIFIPLILIAVLFFSCKVEDEEIETPVESTEGCYIVNFGNYNSGGASISKYDYVSDKMTNFYYQQQNNGQELLSNIQDAITFNDSVYFIGNSPDQLIVVDKMLKQTRNGVTDQLYNPRFCVGDGNYLYISCLGANPDWTSMPDSYIAVFNLETYTVEKTISVPGGPEGLEIAKGKLFAALNYRDSVAVIRLNNDKVTYIETPAVTSYFLKDDNENLYVTLVSTYADFSIETGIGYINTTNEKLSETFPLENVSTAYGSIIQSNADFSKIYLVTSSYDAEWNLTGAVSAFDVASGTFDAEPLISGVSGISGLAFNDKNSQLYVFSAPTATGAGSMKIYSEDGNFIKDYAVGASPIGAFFLE